MGKARGPWFRKYAESIRSRKVRGLSDRAYRLWDTLMCLACENDGRPVTIDDLKFALSWRLDGTKSQLSALLDANLVVHYDGGYLPHEWQEHQYKSDTSTDRVRSHREKRNVSCNSVETPPDTDTDTDKKDIPNGISKKPPKLPEDDCGFAVWWDAFPRQRRGSKPKAERAYRQCLDRGREDGLTVERLLWRTQAYAQSDEVARGYAKGAEAWLNDDRWAVQYERLAEESRAGPANDDPNSFTAQLNRDIGGIQ